MLHQVLDVRSPLLWEYGLSDLTDFQLEASCLGVMPMPKHTNRGRWLETSPEKPAMPGRHHLQWSHWMGVAFCSEVVVSAAFLSPDHD